MPDKPTYEELEHRVKELEKGAIERKQMEASLRKEKEFATSLIDNAPIFFAAIDAQGKTMMMNQHMLKTLGYMTDEVVGKDYLSNFVPEKDRDMLTSVFNNLTAEHKHTLNVNHVLSKDGREFLIEWHGTPVFDISGEFQYFYGIGVNITDRKQAEEALRESEKRYKSLFKNNHSVMLLIDPENADIVDANPAAISYYGWRYEELTCKKITNINSLTEEQVFQEMEQAKKEHRQHFYFRHCLANGDIRDVEVYSGPIQLHGRQLLYSIIHDITERKKMEEALRESEERYRAIFELAADSIVIIDPDTGMLLDFNEKAHENLGYTRQEFAKFKVPDFEVVESKEEVLKHMKKIIKKGSDIFETKHRTNDNDIRNILVSCRTISFQGRDIIQSIWRDITERKQAEKILRKTHDELEDKIRERTTELEKSKSKLIKEIKEHKKTEKKLRKREKELENKTSDLEELNAALKVLLDKRGEDKIELQNNILLNVKTLIEPYVDKLKQYSLLQGQKTLISILESNLNEIVSPFTRKLSSKLLNLSPSEIQVANLVKHGKTNKEIAEMLHVTKRTIAFHRENIRKKLGIKNQKTNLKTYLMSLD